MTRSRLLTVDSVLNLVLGAFLVVFPRSLASFVGVPQPDSAFYPSVLGGVLFGIGIALWMERRPRRSEAAGLGLGGATAINLCGAAVLAGWLLSGDLDLPSRGSVFLWTLVAVLVVVSGLEGRSLRMRRDAA